MDPPPFGSALLSVCDLLNSFSDSECSGEWRDDVYLPDVGDPCLARNEVDGRDGPTNPLAIPHRLMIAIILTQENILMKPAKLRCVK